MKKISFAILIIGLFAVTIPISLAAISDVDIQDLINDPNSKVVVNNATYSATPVTTTTTPTVAASTATRPTLTIDSPTEGSVVTDTNLIISGKSSANTIVNIDIVDSDFSVKYIKHEELENTLGVTTADKNGNWVFSSQSNLELGKYAISAYVTDSQYGKIEIGPVHITVSNLLGKTQNIIFWRSFQFWIFVFFILLIIQFVGYLIFRKKITFKNKLFNFKFNKPKIESEKPVSQFITSEEINKKIEEENAERTEQMEKLEKEIASVKETLIETAENIAEAGKVTEEIEEVLSEIQDEKEKKDDKNNTKLA